ncbi:hypothetical protein GCM10010836_50160 [Aminobacter aminovorans]
MAAAACPAVSQASERGKLQQLLASNGVAEAERVITNLTPVPAAGTVLDYKAWCAA